MNCVYSPLALADLEHIQDDVWEVSRDIDTTDRYMNALMDRVEAKAEWPRSGAPLHHLDNTFTGYYFVPYKAYIAFYHPVDDGIYVDRILPARCDYMDILIKTGSLPS